MGNASTRRTDDQAVRLRRLARETRGAGAARRGGAQPGRLIAVAGAKGGVGATSLSLQLARAFARRGEPTLLVDANLRQADLAHAALASTEGRHDLADVLAGVCRTEDARMRLDENLDLLPGAWAPAAQPDANADAIRRWLDELDAVAAAGETTVLDIGVGMKPWTEPLWRRATDVVLVATPDNLAVLDAYATTKLARSEGVETRIGLLVNRAGDQAAAEAVHRRVDETCRRFLGEPMPLVGWAPDDHRLMSDPARPPRHAELWVQALTIRLGAARAA